MKRLVPLMIIIVIVVVTAVHFSSKSLSEDRDCCAEATASQASADLSSESENLESCCSEKLAAAKCTGASNCRACKNCKYCKYCAKDGGSCGVCANDYRK